MNSVWTSISIVAPFPSNVKGELVTHSDLCPTPLYEIWTFN